LKEQDQSWALLVVLQQQVMVLQDPFLLLTHLRMSHARLQRDLASSSLSNGCKCLNGWSSSSSASCKRWVLQLLDLHQDKEAAAAVPSSLVVCYHVI
jgi:hypothetical protein